MNNIALELARLHVLKGADFVRQLKMLAQLKIFKPVKNEKDIFAAEASHHEDFGSLLDAARKAVDLGVLAANNRAFFDLIFGIPIRMRQLSPVRAFGSSDERLPELC